MKRNVTDKTRRTLFRALHRPFLAAIWVVSVFGSPMAATADDSGPVIAVDMTFANGTARRTEQIDARMTHDNGVDALDLDSLLSVLEPRLSDEVYADLEERGNGAWITVGDIEDAGIDFSFDPAQLSGELSVPADMQPIQSVSLQGSRSLPDYPVAGPATVSFALPVNLSGTYRQDELQDNNGAGNTSYSLSGRVNPRLSLGQTLISGDTSLSYAQEDIESGNLPTLTSADARIERDFGSGVRIGAGSVGTTVAGTQPARDVLGVSFERRAGIGGLSFDRDTYRQVITVETDSTIEIRVNDRLIRSTRILPGQYELSDLPLVSGTNDVEITITDAFGETRRIEDRLHFSRELLPPGGVEFSLSGGIAGADWVDVFETREAFGDIPSPIDSPREASEAVPEVLDAAYFAQSGLRIGVFEPLTAEVFGEATVDNQLAGAGLQLAGGPGVLGINASATHETGSDLDDFGYAVEGRYSLSFDRVRWAPSFRVSGEYASERFRAPGSSIGSTSTRLPDSWRTNASVSQPLPFGTSLLVGARHTISREPEQERTGVFASLGTRIGSALSLRTTGRVNYDGEETDWSARVSVSLRPASRTTITSSYDVQQETMSARLRQDAGNRNVDVSLSAGASGISPADGALSAADASTRLRTTRAQASGGVRFDYPTGSVEDGPDRFTARGTFGTGLYFADGLLGIGRATDGSYALVSRERSLPRGPVMVNPSDDGFEARTGLLGAAVVTSLTDYTERPLRTELPAVPIDYGLGETGRIIETGYRSGTAVRIDGERLLYGTGRLLADNSPAHDSDGDTGDPLALRVFDVFDKDGNRVTSAFTDEDGRFAVYDLSPGEYTVSIDGNGRTARFALDGNEAIPFDLGTIRMVNE